MGLSMFMTNDVALLTLVPITLLIGKKGNFNPFKLVALETVAANVGSSLTPFGNPQNIFLFNQYQLSVGSFMCMTILFVSVATVGLYVATFTCQPTHIAFDLDPITVKSKKKLALYLVLFVVAILSIVHFIPWQFATVLILGSLLVFERHLILQIDYFLLGTFMLFFLLVDNLLAVPNLQQLVSSYLQNPVQVMWFSAISSQFISNVPSAILFEPFVSDVKPLLMGVSLGGMGTLIASLANLISWKLYVKEYPKTIYFRYFTRLNVILFIVVGLILSFLI
jgi:Na+/H+ antiporter NhaD/arsenite permease-like protein